MFEVKICGLRFTQDVQAVRSSGGDAIGLNFFPKSIRYVDPNQPATRELSQAAAAAGLWRVGVFVNEPAGRIGEIVDCVGLDAVQLHGDESLEAAARIRGPRLRAIKLPTGPLTVAQIDEGAAAWIDAGFHLLFDADAGPAHGGSGKTLDWPSIAAWADANPRATWTLAGGLTPENVAQAIRQSGATSVDTASGVESPKGVKSAPRIQQFVQNVRSR